MRRQFHTFVPFDEFESKALAKMRGDIQRSQDRIVTKAEIVRACVRHYVTQFYGPDFVMGNSKQILDRTRIKLDD